MKDLKKIKLIAYYTAKEIIKSKILINTLFLGLGLLLITFVSYSFTYGEPSKIALDFGLGTLSLSSVGIAIFMGAGLLSKEIESRTVYMIVSRPVSRSSFIIGKVLGLSGVLLLNIMILSCMTLACYFVIGGEFQWLILWSILFIILESLIVLLCVTTLSLVTSSTLSVIFTLMLYISGHSINVAQMTSFAENSVIFKNLLGVYHYILPAFYKLNLKEFVLYKQNVETSYLLSIGTYGIVYSVMLLSIAIIIFNKKNLD